jgi:hypothetical protein
MVRVKVPMVAVVDVDMTNVEEALPPEVGVTLAGENAALTPLGKTLETERLTPELKLFKLPTVTATLPLLLCVMVNEAGERASVKSCGGVTVRVSVPEAPSALEFALIPSEKIPVTAAAEALSVRVEAALPPAGTVRVPGVNVPSTPLGNPGRLKLTVSLAVLELKTLMVVAA